MYLWGADYLQLEVGERREDQSLPLSHHIFLNIIPRSAILTSLFDWHLVIIRKKELLKN